MRVIGVRRRVEPVPGVERIVPPELLEEVAAEADYLAIAAPLTRATRGAISRDVIGRMKKTAWIVNIARGAIVDEDALVEALRAGRLGGAGLDVFTTEPLPADHRALDAGERDDQPALVEFVAERPRAHARAVHREPAPLQVG